MLAFLKGRKASSSNSVRVFQVHKKAVFRFLRENTGPFSNFPSPSLTICATPKKRRSTNVIDQAIIKDVIRRGLWGLECGG